ncbi:hypothetical protein BPT24_239 [Tenacibaculum phage pT24]|uniref:Uncharacterized protein n=1 Tax=Tenacibaculum phage pT24 TaxID=1880590 RepID=A0A1B4XX30_9CAUD|nr:hypothetical protein HYP10_gp289 [Tenacibaculum phage pT24]BAV39359.1 hypothetical protein BPT24_239 [Tenacibaculum phage pT24]
MKNKLCEIREKLYQAMESGDKIDMGFAINDLDTFIYNNKEKLESFV